MHPKFTPPSYEKLGEVLESLSKHQEVVSSTSLQKTINAALFFYKNIENDIQLLRTRISKLRGDIEDLKIRHVNDPEFLRMYTVIRDAGGDPQIVYKYAKANGLTNEMIQKLFQEVFGFNNSKAKEVIAEVEKM